MATLKVRDMLKKLAADGWIIVRQEGSHRQLKNVARPGTVTVHGSPNDDIREGTLKSIERQAGWRSSGPT